MDDFERELVSIRPHLTAFARNMTRSRDVADDLRQEVLCKALENRHRFKLGTNLRAWLFIIMRNQWLTQLRKERIRKTDSLDDPSLRIVDPSIIGNQEDTVQLHEVLAAMAQLPPHMVEALEMVGIDGFKYEEAAEVIDVALGTIKSRVSRGREQLTSFLEDTTPAKKPDIYQIRETRRLLSAYG